MNNKYLISETTKEERKDIVKKALGISLLGADRPSDDVLDLAKQYIDGKIEIEEIQKKVWNSEEHIRKRVLYELNSCASMGACHLLRED